MSAVHLKITSILDKIGKLEQKAYGLQKENEDLHRELAAYKQKKGHLGQSDALRMKIEEIIEEVSEVIDFIESAW